MNHVVPFAERTQARPTPFLELLGELSAGFINMSLDDIDGEIVSAEKRICEATGIDRCTLWQFSENHDDLIATHVWSSTGETAPPLLKLQERFPWAGMIIRRGDIVRLSSVADDLPPDAVEDRASFAEFRTKSTLTIPLRVSTRLTGAVSFACTTVERVWSDRDVHEMQLVAQVFANALDRKAKDRALRESERRLNIAGSAAGVGFWGMDEETGSVWATQKAKEMLQCSREDKLDPALFFGKVLPEDRNGLLTLLRETLVSGHDMAVDVRLDGAEPGSRWIAVRGSAAFDPSSSHRQFMGVIVNISERKRAEEGLRNSLEEIKRLKDLIYAEADLLKGELEHTRGHTEILGESAPIRKIMRQIDQVSQTNATVLITGETGTGKELVARAIHGQSARKDRVMVKVDCASLPPGLIESELFGRERGAFTGALAKQIGRFQLADKSTIFLDEIGELPLEVQTKLLRILDTGEFEPLGSPKTINVNVRVIAATNRDLGKAMREGRFREDLFYRLRVFPIEVPPLRDRADDVPVIAWHFIRKYSAEMGKIIRNVRKPTMEALQKYNWPGNVRELRNLIEHALITSTGDTLTVKLPQSGQNGFQAATATLADSNQQHIRAVLERTSWRIKGPGGAAELLGVKPSTLYAKMKKYHIPLRRERDKMTT